MLGRSTFARWTVKKGRLLEEAPRLAQSDDRQPEPPRFVALSRDELEAPGLLELRSDDDDRLELDAPFSEPEAPSPCAELPRSGFEVTFELCLSPFPGADLELFSRSPISCPPMLCAHRRAIRSPSTCVFGAQHRAA